MAFGHCAESFCHTRCPHVLCVTRFLSRDQHQAPQSRSSQPAAFLQQNLQYLTGKGCFSAQEMSDDLRLQPRGRDKSWLHTESITFLFERFPWEEKEEELKCWNAGELFLLLLRAECLSPLEVGKK